MSLRSRAGQAEVAAVLLLVNIFFIDCTGVDTHAQKETLSNSL